MKKVSDMNYSEFCEYLDGDGYDKFETILEYDEFCVYREIATGKYFYLEGGENDASDFFEVEPIATLIYDVNHDINEEDVQEHLIGLFECSCCGEYVKDDCIEYIWFQQVEDTHLTKLSDQEWDVLDKIATKSKMDCWFCLQEAENGNHYVEDLEENKKLSLAEGICQLDSGFTSPEDYDLTKEEFECYQALVRKVANEVADYCPLGGDIMNDCADCAYAGEYHYKDGECVIREEE